MKKNVYLVSTNAAGTHFAAYIDHNAGEGLTHVWPKWDGTPGSDTIAALAKKQGWNVQMNNLNKPRFFINGTLWAQLACSMNADRGAAYQFAQILRAQGETAELSFSELSGGAVRYLASY